jgi:hypothetical protein
MIERRGRHRASNANCGGSPSHVAGVEASHQDWHGDDDPTVIDEVAG